MTKIYQTINNIEATVISIGAKQSNIKKSMIEIAKNKNYINNHVFIHNS